MKGKSVSGKLKILSLKKTIIPYLGISPAMIFLFLFVLYPMVNLVYLSFFDYSLVGQKEFIGLDNYKALFFYQKDFLITLKNTAVYTAAVVFFLILFAVLFAVWFQKDTGINHFAQKAVFTPYLVAMISCGLIWSWIMDTKGLLNAVMQFFQLPGLRWLNSSDTAMLSIVIVSVWRSIGYYMLIVIGSLKAIPAEIYEAAELDNTGPFRKFFRITLPLLSPQLLFLLVTITINSFKVFDTVRIMTAGGPGNSTDVITYYIFRYAFENFKYGQAAAAGTVLMIVLLILTLVYFKVGAKRIHYQ